MRSAILWKYSKTIHVSKSVIEFLEKFYVFSFMRSYAPCPDFAAMGILPLMKWNKKRVREEKWLKKSKKLNFILTNRMGLLYNTTCRQNKG